VFFLLTELSKNDDFIAKLSFGSKVQFGVVAETTFQMAKEVVESDLVEDQQDSAAPKTVEDQLRDKARGVKAELRSKFRQGQDAVAPYVDTIRQLPGGQEVIDALKNVAMSTASDAIRMSDDLLKTIAESGAVPLVGDLIKLILSLINFVNSEQAKDQQRLQQAAQEVYQRTKQEADRLRKSCVDGVVQVASRGQMFPSDIFATQYRADGSQVVSDLGRALMAVVNPDASDLEAIRYINSGDWSRKSVPNLKLYQSPDAWPGTSIPWFDSHFPSWIYRRPVLYPQPIRRTGKNPDGTTMYEYGLAPWDFELAADSIRRGPTTRNFDLYRQLWSKWGSGGTRKTCPDKTFQYCELLSYNGSFGEKADVAIDRAVRTLKGGGWTRMAEEAPSGLALRSGPAPSPSIGVPYGFQPTADRPRDPATGVRGRWPDPRVKGLPTIGSSDVPGAILGTGNSAKFVWNVSPRTQSLFSMMHRLILEEQGVGGDKGRRIFPYFLDLLVYELNAGRITDGAITAILARHFPCWDVNQTSRDSLYRMLIQWQYSNIAQTPEQVQEREQVRSAMEDLSDKLVSDPRSLVGSPLIPKDVLDKYIGAYDKRNADRARRTASLNMALKQQQEAQKKSDETKVALGTVLALGAVAIGAFAVYKQALNSQKKGSSR
jgi:hypothetical protein